MIESSLYLKQNAKLLKSQNHDLIIYADFYWSIKWSECPRSTYNQFNESI